VTGQKWTLVFRNEFLERFRDRGHIVFFLHLFDLGGIGFFPVDLAKVAHQNDAGAFAQSAH
jgi:hypothetical protein